MQDFGNVSDYNNAKPSTNPVVGATSGVQDFGNVSDYGSGYTAGSNMVFSGRHDLKIGVVPQQAAIISFTAS